MFTVIGIMFTGIIIGYLLRSKKLNILGRIITVLIWLLLFLLGIDVGSNQDIINALPTLGLEALFITIAAVTGSCLAAWILWLLIYKKKGEKV